MLQIESQERVVSFKHPKSDRTTLLYSIKVFARYAGKCSQTIRNWEKDGVIPPTPFRVHGDRMYSEEMIMSVADNIKKYNVKPGKVSLAEFSEKVKIEWNDIIDDIMKH